MQLSARLEKPFPRKGAKHGGECKSVYLFASPNAQSASNFFNTSPNRKHEKAYTTGFTRTYFDGS
jgi:hypothetical protein